MLITALSLPSAGTTTTRRLPQLISPSSRTAMIFPSMGSRKVHYRSVAVGVMLLTIGWPSSGSVVELMWARDGIGDGQGYYQGGFLVAAIFEDHVAAMLGDDLLR